MLQSCLFMSVSKQVVNCCSDRHSQGGLFDNTGDMFFQTAAICSCSMFETTKTRKVRCFSERASCCRYSTKERASCCRYSTNEAFSVIFLQRHQQHHEAPEVALTVRSMLIKRKFRYLPLFKIVDLAQK